MLCAFCGKKFEAADNIITLNESNKILHRDECFTNYMFDVHCDDELTYLEYLESLVTI